MEGEHETRAEAEAAAERFRASGPFHSRALRETFFMLNNPADIQFTTCSTTGSPVTLIDPDRKDILDIGKEHFDAAFKRIERQQTRIILGRGQWRKP
jgi:hypothetical protein